MNNGEDNRYCGSSLPFMERTFNGSVQIDFHSDYRYERIGFLIVYRIDRKCKYTQCKCHIVLI